MASNRVNRKQQQQTGSSMAVYAAGFFLLLGLLTAAGIIMDVEGGFLGFVAKCELYLLGKGSFLLPLTCFLLSWKLYLEKKLALWQKKTLAIFLVMLCLLGTAHHVFVPAKEELAPHLLPAGGGLVGGIIVSLLHKYLGSLGSSVALALGWLVSLGLLLPVGTIWNWLTDLVAGITGEKDEEYDEALPPQPEPVQKATKNIFKPITTTKAKPVETQKAGNKNNIEKVYRSGEFGSFTDGIEK